MGRLLSDILRNHPINKYNNCTLPDDSEIKIIDYRHTINKNYQEYRNTPSFILYQRKNTKIFHIYFKK